MVNEGKIDLYLTKDSTGQQVVSNWPGSLKFTLNRVVTGRHNWLRSGQTYVYFVGPDGFRWTGRNVGYNEILRCKRTMSVAGVPKAA